MILVIAPLLGELDEDSEEEGEDWAEDAILGRKPKVRVSRQESVVVLNWLL